MTSRLLASCSRDETRHEMSREVECENGAVPIETVHLVSEIE